jgi:hypothetical protein
MGRSRYSPGIDAGKTSDSEAEKDRDGKKRPVDMAWDMGTYEFGKASSILFLVIPAVFLYHTIKHKNVFFQLPCLFD